MNLNELADVISRAEEHSLQQNRELTPLKNMIVDAIADTEEIYRDRVKLNVELRTCKEENRNLVGKLAKSNEVSKSLRNSLSSMQRELDYYKEENARLKDDLRSRDKSSCQNLRESQKHSDECKNSGCSNHRNDCSCHHKDKLCVDNMHVGVCSMPSDEDIDEVVRMIIDTLKNAVR